MLRVLSDILDALDRGDFAVLIRLIRSTTPLCYVDFSQLTVSLALRWSGLPVTFMRENYLYGTEVPVLLHHLCYAEYPKGRSFLLYTADLLGLIEGMDLHPHPLCGRHTDIRILCP